MFDSTKKKTQEIAGQSDRDSGYYSQALGSARSSRQLSARSSASVYDDAIARPRLKLQGIRMDYLLSEFDKEISEIIISRFNCIRIPIEHALLNQVYPSGAKNRQMAVRLMVLGVSDQDAKPYIVVFAAEEYSKVVIGILKTQSIQAVCKPVRPSEPQLDVLVYARPPRSRSSDNFAVDIPTRNGRPALAPDTYCGAPIIVRSSSGAERYATLGGVIKGYRADRGRMLYGLTARHVLRDLEDDSSAQPSHETASSEQPGSEWPPFEGGAPSAWVASGLQNLGYIREEVLSKNLGRDYDWALVKMVDYRANRLSLSGQGMSWSAELPGIRETQLQMPSSAWRCHTKQSIIVISGSAGHKHGNTSAVPARFLSENARDFVDTLVVKMQPGEDIVDGDSGSFVVNDRTVEVYGHVVAADDFGGGYVMPFEKTLQDIKGQMKFDTITLASIDDIQAANPDKKSAANAEKKAAPGQSAASSLAAELLKGEMRQTTRKGEGRSKPPPPISIGTKLSAKHGRPKEKPGFFRSLWQDRGADPEVSSVDEPVEQALIVDHRTLAPWDPPDSGYGTGEGSRTHSRTSYEMRKSCRGSPES